MLYCRNIHLSPRLCLSVLGIQVDLKCSAGEVEEYTRSTMKVISLYHSANIPRFFDRRLFNNNYRKERRESAQDLKSVVNYNDPIIERIPGVIGRK